MNDALIIPDWPAPGSVNAFTTTRSVAGETELAAQLPAAVELPRLRQVHGRRVVEAVDAAGAEADAVVTRRTGTACMVATADCLPLLVCNRDGDEIAAIHAGWRGLAAGIIEAALGSLSSAPAELMVWLGPAICSFHYEVGSEVREQILGYGGADLRRLTERCFEGREPGKYLADLPAVARAQLAQLGCGEVYGSKVCSYGDAARCHSYRRDGEASGRMLSVIYIRP